MPNHGRDAFALHCANLNIFFDLEEDIANSILWYHFRRR